MNGIRIFSFARWVLPAAVALAVAGCATFSEKKSFRDTPVRVDHSSNVLVERRAYDIAPGISNVNLVLNIVQKDTCEISDTPVVHRFADVQKSGSGPITAASEAILGASLVGLGAFGYFDADSLAAQAQSDGSSMAHPKDFQILGAGMAGVGAVALVVAIVDATRGKDETRDLGLVRLDSTRSEIACGSAPLSQSVVHIAFAAGAAAIDGKTDDKGRVSISLASVPEAAFDSDGAIYSVTVASSTTNLKISANDAALVRDRLVSDPSSRIARDREARRVETCKSAIVELRGQSLRIDDDEAKQVLAKWASARTACVDQWSPVLEQAEAEARADLGPLIARRSQERCAKAGQDFHASLSASDLSLASDAVATMRERCTTSHADIAHLKIAEERLRNLVRELEQAQQLDRRRQEIDADLRSDDLAEADAIVQTVPAVIRVLRADPEISDLIRDAVIRSLEATVENQNGARAQLCHGRRLFQQVCGQAAWSGFVRMVAERVGSHDPVLATRAINVLKTRGCR